MMTSSFTSAFLFLLSSLKCQIIIRDLRTGCGRWVVYVFMRGGEGRARLLDWARIFFPNLILWLIFPYFYFGGARSKRFATLRNVSKLQFFDKIGQAKSVGFRLYSAIWRSESRISSRYLEITSISLIYSLTFSRKKELLFWLSRGLNRLTCVTRQVRGDSKLRD